LIVLSLSSIQLNTDFVYKITVSELKTMFLTLKLGLRGPQIPPLILILLTPPHLDILYTATCSFNTSMSSESTYCYSPNIIA
jgi:hypothetical protein